MANLLDRPEVDLDLPMVDLLDLRGTLPQEHLEGVHQVALILTATLQLIKVTIMIQKL